MSGRILDPFLMFPDPCSRSVCDQTLEYYLWSRTRSFLWHQLILHPSLSLSSQRSKRIQFDNFISLFPPLMSWHQNSPFLKILKRKQCPSPPITLLNIPTAEHSLHPWLHGCTPVPCIAPGVNGLLCSVPQYEDSVVCFFNFSKLKKNVRL